MISRLCAVVLPNPMLGMAGINGDPDRSVHDLGQVGEAFEHRDHPRQLLVDSHGLGARARRLPAHVQDGRPLGNHGATVRDGHDGILEATAVGEGVGRDVQNAHDQTPATFHGRGYRARAGGQD